MDGHRARFVAGERDGHFSLRAAGPLSMAIAVAARAGQTPMPIVDRPVWSLPEMPIR